MSYQNIEVKPIAGRIGAKIKGVNLAENLSDEIISEIRKALVEYKVIFFRGQELDANGQVDFARRFGEITTAHPTVPSLPGHPEVLDLDYSRTGARSNNWHTDVTFVDRPPLGSVLRALVIPPAGGDTIWANSVTAYQDLPEHLRNLADKLWAVHSNAYDYATAFDIPEEVKSYRDVFTSTVYETLHPVVRIHPESGEKGLFIGGFVRQIRGLSPTESAEIIRLLQSYVTRPENTVRWRWKVGDVAFWDNRATQHYAIADYGDQPRRVQRVTIAGDIPLGIDGKYSQAIKGDSAAYIPNLVASLT
jgi:taurine dioxygenase